MTHGTMTHGTMTHGTMTHETMTHGTMTHGTMTRGTMIKVAKVAKVYTNPHPVAELNHERLRSETCNVSTSNTLV
jgi:hypothetical protein